MFTLIIGGAGSGKSAFAEALLQTMPEPKSYIATMEAFDGESRARIARHREMRRDKGFETLERYTDLAGAALPEGGSALLEDVSNLLANEMFSPNGSGAGAVIRGVDALLKRCRNLVAVSNEVFSGGSDYGEETLAFMGALAEINRSLAERADTVAEIVCGIPNVLKGEING